MTWAKIDDAILDNPKIAKAGVYGFAMHVAAITWCARNLTDGHIPYARVTALLTLTKVWINTENPMALPEGRDSHSGNTGLDPYVVANHLVSVGLWHATDSGYEVHDYLKYNPSRAQVLAERERSKKRVQKHRSNGVCNGVTTGVSNAYVAVAPVPVPYTDQIPPIVPPEGNRPEKVTRKVRRPDRVPLPVDWEAKLSHGVHADNLSLDWKAEESAFKDSAQANGRLYADWDAAFHTWLRNAHKFAGRSGVSKSSTTPVKLDPKRKAEDDAKLWAEYERAMAKKRREQAEWDKAHGINQDEVDEESVRRFLGRPPAA